MYCSHCYQKGEFLLPHITVEQMQERVKEKLAELHIPNFLRSVLTRCIQKLERWQ